MESDTSTALVVVVNAIAILTALLVSARWLRGKAGKALRQTVVSPVSELAEKNKEIMDAVSGVSDQVAQLGAQINRAQDRMDRHLESHQILGFAMQPLQSQPSHERSEHHG